MAKVYQANEIKNIALMGGSGSGKTTLMESMLFVISLISLRLQRLRPLRMVR